MHQLIIKPVTPLRFVYNTKNPCAKSKQDGSKEKYCPSMSKRNDKLKKK
jgi:hypothetical protein